MSTASRSLFAGLALATLLASAPSLAASPTISGTPPTTVTPGGTYSFAPTVRDADGDRVTCRFRGQPSWMNTSASACRLYGTAPARLKVGTVYPNITISATDGKRLTSLPTFSVKVVAKSGSTGTLTLTGTPPTTATVGTPYTFTPQLSNSTGAGASFSIVNKPAWLGFSTATGALSGTPSAANVGSYSGITIRVTNGSTTSSLPAFTITVSAAPASGNRAPTISGTPPTTVAAGSPYSFKPTASDADRDSLTFAASNKPAWASFSTTTGELSGTPTAAQLGSYGNIEISVSDGKGGRAALQPFSILVTAGSARSVTLSWNAPTQMTDGSPISGLAGYRIFYGNSATNLDRTLSVANPSLTTATVTDLTSGTWYFAVSAYTNAAESERSAVATRALP